MSWQHVELNMIPGGELPVVHVSQFDTLRAFHFDLKVGDDDWTIPEGIHFELHCRKVDDNIVIIAPDSTDTSSVTFTTTEQLTACSGKNECELVAIDDEDDSLIIGSINFILDVEADPLAGGLTSETAIYNLTQQIEEIAEQVIGEDYYDKTEVDTLLADKADLTDLPDMTQYYNKTQTDTLLNAKADASDVYTKAQVDSALSAKANTADLATVATTGDYDDLLNKPTLPDMTNYYTKSEVDALIDDIFPTLMASGGIATFTTALNKPLVSVTADPLATEITRCGKNLFNKTDSVVEYYVSADGSYQASGDERSVLVGYMHAGTYTISKRSTTRFRFGLYANPPERLDSAIYFVTANPHTATSLTITLPSDGYGVIFFWNGSSETGTVDEVVDTIQVEVGSTATAYETYNAITKPIADATTITTLSYVNNVFTDAGSVTVQYKYMSI